MFFFLFACEFWLKLATKCKLELVSIVSAVDRAKRALVTLICFLAARYNCRVTLTRDSPDPAVSTAYRSVSRKVHPDRGGDEEDQKKLNCAHDDWCDALRHRKPQQVAKNLAKSFKKTCALVVSKKGAHSGK